VCARSKQEERRPASWRARARRRSYSASVSAEAWLRAKMGLVWGCMWSLDRVWGCGCGCAGRHCGGKTYSANPGRTSPWRTWWCDAGEGVWEAKGCGMGMLWCCRELSCGVDKEAIDANAGMRDHEGSRSLSESTATSCHGDEPSTPANASLNLCDSLSMPLGSPLPLLFDTGAMSIVWYAGPVVTSLRFTATR
jgi:hypothetical protein